MIVSAHILIIDQRRSPNQALDAFPIREESAIEATGTRCGHPGENGGGKQTASEVRSHWCGQVENSSRLRLCLTCRFAVQRARRHGQGLVLADVQFPLYCEKFFTCFRIARVSDDTSGKPALSDS